MLKTGRDPLRQSEDLNDGRKKRWSVHVWEMEGGKRKARGRAGDSKEALTGESRAIIKCHEYRVDQTKKSASSWRQREMLGIVAPICCHPVGAVIIVRSEARPVAIRLSLCSVPRPSFHRGRTSVNGSQDIRAEHKYYILTTRWSRCTPSVVEALVSRWGANFASNTEANKPRWL